MAIQGLDASIPNYNVAPPDIIGYQEKMAQLKNLLGQNQMIPGALQAQGLENQQRTRALTTADLENQQRQLELNSQQSMMNAWKDPTFTNNITGGGSGQSAGMGFDPDAMIRGLVGRGVLPKDAVAAASSFTELAKNASLKTKDDLSNYKDSHDQLFNLLAPIADMEPDKALKSLNSLKAKLSASPIPGLDPVDAQLLQSADVEHLPAMLGVMGFTGKLLDFHKDQAEASEKASAAEQKKLEIAPPTKDQLTTFTKQTIPAFSALRPEQKNAYIAEAKDARTVTEFNSIVARADATDKAEQMHADSLSQTKAMVGNKFGDAGLTANEKIWTDPQHGFAGALAQAKQTKQAIVAGADGNGLMTSMVPTMEVLGVNHAAGISRISPQEAQAAGVPGGWAERWNAWATKAATGKLTPRLAQEGQQLMDVVLDAAHQKALVSSALISKGHGLTPDQTPAMDRNGNVTTLDKAMTGNISTPPPTGKFSVTAPDGSVHPFETKAQADKFKELAKIK